MRIAVFTDNVEREISALWNRINLALILHVLPSQIDGESYKDIQAFKVILSAREEYKEMENNRGDNTCQLQ